MATTVVTASRLFASSLLIASVIAIQPANALTKDQAVDTCKARAKPQVISCMKGGGSLDKCKVAATPGVVACVTAALNAANGRANVAISVDNGQKQAPVDIGNALPAGFVPPPRTIADINAVLDASKPDPAVLDKLKSDADADPGTKSGNDLAQFYYARATARALLGRNAEALADAQAGLEPARKGSSTNFYHRIQQFIGLQKMALGDLKGMIAAFQDLIRETGDQNKAWQIDGNRFLIAAYLQAGDIAQADGLLRNTTAMMTTARTSGLPAWRTSYNLMGRLWEADYESTRGSLFEAHGNYHDAEQSYSKASQYWTAALPGLDKIPDHAPASQIRQAADGDLGNAARVKAKQGRFAEAEVDARSALLSRLKDQGKYNPQTTRYVVGLANVLNEEGRYEEAEKLMRSALDIQRTVGVTDDTQGSATILAQLGSVLIYQRKQQDAADVYAQLDKAVAKWDPARRDALLSNGSRIQALLYSGQTDQAITEAEALVKRQVARVGENNYDAASAHGTLATAYAKAGRVQDALREFRTAIPVLMTASQESDNDDSGVLASRSDRLQYIVENYIALLAKNSPNSDSATETFALADSIRGQSVQNALEASSARSAAKDPALAELVRNEQDLSKQVDAELGALNNALSANVRDDAVIKATNAAIDKLRSDRDKARGEITAKFPAYADLVSPKPPTVDKIKATLADGEALLSFYFGHDGSFVWAVPKDGDVAFAAIPLTAGELEAKVHKLREALEPEAETISDIPPFDVDLGYELYSQLLKPVEAGWKQSKSLVVVTNGALGLLPLSLLPTAPSQIRKDDTPLFASYRDVPWLARTHAVTMVPSASALVTLRQTPPGSASRKDFVGFGDPLFSREEADEAAQDAAQAGNVQVASLDTPPPAAAQPQAAVMRGLPLKRRSAPKLDGIDSADLGMLPRLPDTADELKSIALALKADPTEVLNLGKNANEDKVKTMDLSGFKIIAFATHGLTAGELNGLTQPALALSAPDVSGTPGDGLLTMEEILTLKLDADWVILSACNTGAGDGAGAEAASGLGRAFFYAGTRALLVTNWSVHSQSARELTTDLFRRQAADPSITRAEALRQAEMALADGPGFTDDSGKTEFAYAHPLFWAPYSIIGDGGKR